MSRAPFQHPENLHPASGDLFTSRRSGYTYEWYDGMWNRVETGKKTADRSSEIEYPEIEYPGFKSSDVVTALRDLASLVEGLRQFNPGMDRVNVRVLRKGIWLSRVPRGLGPGIPIRSKFVAWDRADDFPHLCEKLKELLA